MESLGLLVCDFLLCVQTWEDGDVGVLVAPVRFAAQGVDPGVLPVGRCTEEWPVTWDQLIVVDAQAILLSPAL